MHGSDEVLDIRTFGDITVVQFLRDTLRDQAQLDRIGARLQGLVADEGARKLLLDFENVLFLSSGALGIILELRNRMGGKDGRLEMVNLRPDIATLFRLTKLDSMIPIHPDIDTAIRDLGSPG